MTTELAGREGGRTCCSSGSGLASLSWKRRNSSWGSWRGAWLWPRQFAVQLLHILKNQEGESLAGPEAYQQPKGDPASVTPVVPRL